MKKSLSFFVVVCLTTSVFAQQQIATLLHNDSITVYYGSGALQSAHAAAVNGDVITLSDGTFNSVNITKAVTIRGAGMWVDTIQRTPPTILQGDFTITVPQDSNYWLTLEGIYHYQKVEYKTAYSPQFIKCSFYQFYSKNETGTVMNDAKFFNCIIRDWENYETNSGYVAQNTQFTNSIILDGLSDGSPAQLNNCIAKIQPYYISHKTVINSIVYNSFNGNSMGWNGNPTTSFYSIGLESFNGSNYYDLSSGANHHLYNCNGFSSVFKNFNGTYSDGVSFELKDDVAATKLGSDGTQIGIYGGQMPFDPSVRNPLIGRTTVGRTTTSEGKLEVDIEITTESE